MIKGFCPRSNCLQTNQVALLSCWLAPPRRKSNQINSILRCPRAEWRLDRRSFQSSTKTLTTLSIKNCEGPSRFSGNKIKETDLIEQSPWTKWIPKNRRMHRPGPQPIKRPKTSRVCWMRNYWRRVRLIERATSCRPDSLTKTQATVEGECNHSLESKDWSPNILISSNPGTTPKFRA